MLSRVESEPKCVADGRLRNPSGLSRSSAVEGRQSTTDCSVLPPSNRDSRSLSIPVLHLPHQLSTDRKTAIHTASSMSLLRQSTQALRVAAATSTSARWISTSAVVRNSAQTSPAPAKPANSQSRDVAAEQVARHDQAVAADLVSSAPGT
jgi:hypothetical protein